MNWTGGHLSRSKNARGSLTAKQKAYFAKARARLESGRLPRPAVQSFDLGGWKPTIKITSSPRSSHQSRGHSPKQATLHDFENVEPLARKLDTLKPRVMSSKQKRSPLQPSINKTAEAHGGDADPIVVGSSQSSSSVSSEPSNTSRMSKQRPEDHQAATLSGATSMEEKRRRLLGMNDWVGIHQPRPASKPVKMTFADPADRDLIGKRRKVERTDIQPPERRRQLPRAAPSLTMNAGAIPAAQDQYYSVDDVSVRIGSAVDRSTARTSRLPGEIHSQFSDEILDNGALLSIHPPPSSSRSHNERQSGSLRSSNHRRREVLTPSALMGESSSHGSHPRSQVLVERPMLLSSSTKNPTDMKDWQGSEHSKSELVPEYLPIQDLGSRLVSDDSPYHQAPNLEDDLARPNNGFACSKADVVQPRPRRPKEPIEPKVLSTNVTSIRDQPNHEFPAVTTPYEPRWNLEVPATQTRRAATRQKSDNESLPATILQKEDDNHMTGHFSSANQVIQEVPQVSRRRSELRTQPETALGKQCEGAPPFHKQSEATSLRRESPLQDTMAVTTKGLAKIETLLKKPTEANLPETTEDDEALWRKFVFGDDSSSNDENPQDTNADFEPLNSKSNRYACTQPSLIAEVDTSPLKQNPHLADETFDASTFYTSEFSHRRQTDRTFNLQTEAKSTCQSGPTDPSLSQTEADFPSDDIGQPPLPQPNPATNLNHSSLIGEASSSSHFTPPAPHSNLSSDELQRSPDRLPFVPTVWAQIQKSMDPVPLSSESHTPDDEQRQMEKAVYKKPPRYVGDGSAGAAGPTMLGKRVSRSGRAGDGDGREVMGRGRRRKGRRCEEDEIVDDDDIADD